jgi:gamma-glutamyl-gamma-aminobutyrate hydrolase PuuD
LKENSEEVALVVFTGGQDVWPGLYNENVHWQTHYSIQRDVYEGQMFELALKNGIPMVGICRGSQFLCVKANGKLVQDISGHLGDHEIVTSDDRVLTCNSSHHQMQLPPYNAVPLAWARKKLSNRYLNGDDDQIQIDREYEVVYYPKIRAIGIQYHPEWKSSNHPCVKYAQEVVQNYLFTAIVTEPVTDRKFFRKYKLLGD